MKILYLCLDIGIPVLGTKGASVHVRSMVGAFRRAGHDVVLVTPTLNKSPWEQRTDVDASLLHMPPGPNIVRAVLKLKEFNKRVGLTNGLPGEIRRVLYDQSLSSRLIRRFDSAPPDFIYERAALYGISGAVLAQELKVPRLVELNAPLALEHATYFGGTGLAGLAESAERWTLHQADAVLTVSAPLRDHVVSLGVDPERVHVVPNGVDPFLFHPAPRDPEVCVRWGLDGGPVLGFVGTLRSWQGVEILPAVLEALRPSYPGLRMIVVGDGPLRGRIERELDDRGVRESIVFTGWLPHAQLPALIRQFDVALAPYAQAEHLWYISSLKVFEYMACGVPVVAARLGEMPAVIHDGETGLLYPHGERNALINACRRLLDDPILRERLGREAAALIRERYTWDRNASRTVELARSVKARAQPDT